MARIAYLHPAYSFSHDLVREQFPAYEHVGFDTLEAVVTAVVLANCDLAVVPFYNTTRRSIEESQLALVANRNRVFVADVLPLQVRHFLLGFGSLGELSELWSKNVVFHQISRWRKRKFPDARLVEYPSTSAAIKEIAQQRLGHVGGVGTRSAAMGYGVPILAKNIQNKPNLTLFFVLTPKMPNPENMDHFLMCLPNAKPDDKTRIGDIVAANGCGITSNWPLQTSPTVSLGAYFFEMNGQFSTLDLHSSVTQIGTEFPRAFRIGGYREKCITRLLWHDEPPKRRRHLS